MSEIFWKKIRFLLLSFLISCLLFILLTKVLFKVPLLESRELLESINNSEYILIKQKEYADKVRELHLEVDSLQFEIYQVQRLDVVEKQIYELQNVYKVHNMSNKYIFGVQCTKFLQMYFDCKEDWNALKRSNKVLEKNLDECKANL